MKNYFFIHGGPGFNTKPEVEILTHPIPADKKIYFWNELSPLRNKDNLDNYFTKNLDHLKLCLSDQIKTNGNITPIFFSYGLQYLLYLPPEITDKFNKIILISPSADINKVDNRIYELALKELASSNKDSSEQLEKLMKNLTSSFDQSRIDAFMIVITAPSLFTHYFNSQESMATYFSYLIDQHAFSLDSFFAIRKTQPEWKLVKKINTPTLAIFGQNDPISTFSDQLPLLKNLFNNLDHQIADNHCHFLHIEDPNLFVDCLSR